MNTRTAARTSTGRRTPARSATRRRTAPKPAPLKLSDVNPRVRSTAMFAAGGDAKRIKVISTTQVEVS